MAGENQRTKIFYEDVGWHDAGGALEDTRRWEDLRPCAASYVRACQQRLLDLVPRHGHRLLDVGSGPVVHDAYLELSSRFREHWCVDFSVRALELARARLGDRGTYICTDFLEADLAGARFDCVACLNVLFHVASGRQEEFVRKLLRCARPGSPVVVTYANPRDVTTLLALRPRLDLERPSYPSCPYYHVHPVEWWQRFEDEAMVSRHPLRTLNVEDAKILIPDGPSGASAFGIIKELEDAHPELFLCLCHYYAIVLRARA